MISAARGVLDDCRLARLELLDGVQGHIWRRRWIVNVVLLRAVGHVLDNIDGTHSLRQRQVIDEWWKDLKLRQPKPEIFWHFIDKERNSILKEYQTNAGQSTFVLLPGLEASMSAVTGRVDSPKSTVYRYHMNGGYFHGRDHRELIDEAIEWWAGELDKIEAKSKFP